jgi:hypothetical protein
MKKALSIWAIVIGLSGSAWASGRGPSRAEITAGAARRAINKVFRAEVDPYPSNRFKIDFAHAVRPHVYKWTGGNAENGAAGTINMGKGRMPASQRVRITSP